MNHAANAAILNFDGHMLNHPEQLDALMKLCMADEHRAEQEVTSIIEQIRQWSPEQMKKVFPHVEDQLIANQIVAALKSRYASHGPRTVGPQDPAWR